MATDRFYAPDPTVGNTDAPVSRDLLRVANLIPPEHVFEIAIEYLGLSQIQVSRCRCDAHITPNFAQQYTFNCLNTWLNKQGDAATKRRLHHVLTKASERGFLARNELNFLLPQQQSQIELGESSRATDSTGPGSPDPPVSTRPQVTRYEDRRDVLGEFSRMQFEEDEDEEGQVQKVIYGAADQSDEELNDDVKLYQNKQVALTEKVTQVTDLSLWPETKLCVLQSLRALVFSEKLDDTQSRGPGYYSFSCETGVKQARVEDICRKMHEQVREKNNLLSIHIQGVEYLVAVCAPCCNVQIVETTKWSTFLEAYKNAEVTLGPICLAKRGQLFLLAKKVNKNVQSVYELKAHHRKFTEKRNFETQISNNLSAVAFVAPVSGLVCLEKGTCQIRCVSTQNGASLWDLQPMESHKPLNFAHFFGALITCDGTNILKVYSARDGTYRHDLRDEKLDNVLDLACLDDILVLRQARDRSLELGVYGLKFEYETLA